MPVLYSNSRIFVIPVYISNGRKQTLVDTIGILSALRMRGLHDKRHLLAKLRICGSENCEVPALNLLIAAVVPLGKALYPHCQISFLRGLYSGTSLYRGPWDHENYLVISGFSLYQGKKTKKYKELGPAKLPCYNRVLLYPTSF